MPVAFELQVPHHLREASKAPLRPSLAFGNKVESDHRDHLRLALGPSVQTQPRAVGFHKATRSLAHRAFVHSNVELLRAPSAVAFPECHCPRLNNVQCHDHCHLLANSEVRSQQRKTEEAPAAASKAAPSLAGSERALEGRLEGRLECPLQGGGGVADRLLLGRLWDSDVRLEGHEILL